MKGSFDKMKDKIKQIEEEINEELHRIEWNLKIRIQTRNYGSLLRSFCIIIVVVVLFSLGVSAKKTEAEVIQQGIAGQIVRFHCIANSDSDEDQAVKLKVKEAVVSLLEQKMETIGSKEEAEQIILENQQAIKEVAEQVLRANGYTYGASVCLEDTPFPIKVYGDITLPAGVYEALCVRLGSAEGKNWWCIVFPTLCFVDCTYGYVPEESKTELRHLLTDEEYDAITETSQVKVTVRFKLLDYVKEVFQ